MPLSAPFAPDSPAHPPRIRHRGSWLRRVFFVCIALIALVVIVGALALVGLHRQMRSSLAPLDGTLHVAGLQGPVMVLRDAQGVPHVQAQSMHDLLFAQGFVTASDRLWQMDMARRLPAGEAAEVLGSALVAHDRMERTLGIRDVAAHLAQTLPAEQFSQLQAYASGVNAYIDTARAQGTLPAEFSLLLYKPRPWQPQDSLLIALSMAEMLDERWQAKLKREQLTTRLAAHGAAALAPDLYPTGSWRDHPPVPSAPAITDPQEIPQIPLDESQVGRAAAPAPLLPMQTVLTVAAMAEADCSNCRPGSNEWAVSGAHTASGKPLLSNDMHLEHQIPDIWYESDLSAGQFHVAGVTIPGLPLIAAGHNQHIAWGFTALGGDTQDLYIERLNPQGQYLIRNPDGTEHWEPLQHEQETIRVRGGHDVSIDVERTDHGPILTPLLPGEQRTLSLHWTLYDPETRGLPLYALDAATDWTSFRAALATWWAPTLNVAYADDQGHIGYQAVGHVPIRAGGLQAVPVAAGQPLTPSAIPAMASTPAAPTLLGAWQGNIPFDAMPSVLDPEGGIVATANARITPDGYPYQLTLEWAAPYRNERIWKWLQSRQRLTPADMLTLQTDVFSESDQEIAQKLAYAIDHSKHASVRVRSAADILRSWDGVVGVDSAAAAIVTTAEQNFWPAVLGAKVGDAWHLYDWSAASYAREQLIARQPAAWLPPSYANWNDFLTALVEQSVKEAPSKLQNWHYGDTHTITINHPLWGMLPGFHSGVGPAPQSGDPSTVKQVSGNLGPSQRFTADMSNLDNSTENLVVGQSGDPASPDYRNQWPAWYSGSTFPLAFSSAQVRATATHTLRLEP